MRSFRVLVAIFVGLPLYIISIIPLQIILISLYALGVKSTIILARACGDAVNDKLNRFINWGEPINKGVNR